MTDLEVFRSLPLFGRRFRLTTVAFACALLCACAALLCRPHVAYAETTQSVDTWSALSDALGEDGTADTIKLTADIKADGEAETNNLYVKRKVVLDLNGHVLDRGLIDTGGDDSFGDVGSDTSVLQVGSGASLTLSNSASRAGTITGGVCLYGGGIFVYGGGKLAVEAGVQISGNRANYGGGIYIANGSVDLQRGSVVSSNSAVEGGGIYIGVAQNNANATGGDAVGVIKQTCKLQGGLVQGNSGKNRGGGIFLKRGTLTIESGMISQNVSTGDPGNGAGIYQLGGSVNMSGGSIESNTSAAEYQNEYKEFCYRGAGVYQEGGSFTLSRGSIANNLAHGCGGGFCQSPKSLTASFTMTGGSIVENEAHGADPFSTDSPAYGGGIYQVCDAGKDSLATITITGGFIVGNKATILPSKGGGICTSGGTLELSGCMIANNWACMGGGVYLDYTTEYSSKGQTLTLGPNLAITGNTAPNLQTLTTTQTDNVYIPVQEAAGAKDRVVVATNANSNVGIRTHTSTVPRDGYTDFGIVGTDLSCSGLHSDFGDEHMVVRDPNNSYVALWKHAHTWSCVVDAADASQATVLCADVACPYHDPGGTVVLLAEDAVYDGRVHEAYPKVSGVPRGSCGLSIAYFAGSSAAGEQLDDAPVTVGTYTAVVTIRLDGSNQVDEIQKTYAISKRPAEVQASDQAVIRGNVIEQGPSYASLHASWGREQSGPLQGHRLSDVSLSPTDAQTEPGIIRVTDAKVADAAGVDMAANYDLAYVDGALTIMDVVPAYTPPTPKALTYTGADQELVVPGESEEADILYSLSRQGPFDASIPTGRDAGTYTVWYTVEPKANAPEHLSGIQPQAITVVVAQLPAELSWGYVQATYDGNEHVPSAHVKTNCLKPGDTCAVTVEGAAKDAGTHTATATNLSNANYTLRGGANLSTEFLIKPRTVTVSGIVARDKVYDATTTAMLDCSSVSFGEFGEKKGKLPGDDLSVSAFGVFATADVGTGKYVSLNHLSLTGASASNYVLDSEVQQQSSAMASIAARPVAVRAKNQVVQSGTSIGQGTKYAQLLPVADDTQSGPVEGHTLSSVALAPEGAVTVGGTITPSGAAITSLSDGSRVDVSVNYDIRYEAGTLVVTGDTPTFALPQAKSLVYDGTDQELVEAGTVEEGSRCHFVYSLDAGAALDAWSTEVPVGNAAGSHTVYYQLVEEDGTTSLIGTQSVAACIGKRPVTVVPYDGQGKVYGDADPALRYEVENWSSEMAPLAGSLSRVDGPGAGTYAITQGTLTSENEANANYSITFDTSKTFAIQRRPVTVAGVTAADKVYDGTTVVSLNKANASLLNVLDEDKGDDKLRLVDFDGVFASPDAGEDKDVVLRDVRLEGSSASNYTSRSDQAVAASVSMRKTRIIANDQTVLAGNRINQGVGFARMVRLSDGDHTGPAVGQGLTALTLLPQDPVVDGGVITPQDAVVSDAEDNDVTSNYDIAYEDGVLIVLNVTPSYKAPAVREGLVYDGTAQALVEPGTVDGRDGAVIVYALSEDGEYSESVPRMRDATTYEVWWKIALSSDYSATVGTLPAQRIGVTIAPKEAKLAWANTEFWYDGKEHVPSATVANVLEGDECGVSVSGKQTNVGTYTARATALTNPNYHLPEDATTAFVIRKAEGVVPVRVVCGPGVPNVTSANLQQVAQSLVTDEELGLAANGEELLVWLQVSKLTEDMVPGDDVDAFQRALSDSGAQANTYLDISLFKTVGGTTTRIEETAEPLKLDVTMPEELRKGGRTFSLLRCHDGTATVLAYGTGETLSGESALFSSYLIAYKDADSGDNGGNGGDNSGPHNDAEGGNSKTSGNVGDVAKSGGNSIGEASGTETLARTADSASAGSYLVAGVLEFLGCACVAMAGFNRCRVR